MAKAMIDTVPSSYLWLAARRDAVIQRGGSETRPSSGPHSRARPGAKDAFIRQYGVAIRSSRQLPQQSVIIDMFQARGREVAVIRW